MDYWLILTIVIKDGYMIFKCMDSVNSSEVSVTVQFKNASFYKKIEVITALLRSMELLFNLKSEVFFKII